MLVKFEVPGQPDVVIDFGCVDPFMGGVEVSHFSCFVVKLGEQLQIAEPRWEAVRDLRPPLARIVEKVYGPIPEPQPVPQPWAIPCPACGMEIMKPCACTDAEIDAARLRACRKPECHP